MNKIIHLCTLLIFCCGCSNIKSIIDINSLSVPKHFREETLIRYKATEDNFSLIYLTNYFNNETIIITNDKKIIFEDKISTIESIGLAKIIKIDKKFVSKIYFKNSNFTIKIKSNNYKFIYISKIKDRKKYTVSYSNILHGFM